MFEDTSIAGNTATLHKGTSFAFLRNCILIVNEILVSESDLHNLQIQKQGELFGLHTYVHSDGVGKPADSFDEDFFIFDIGLLHWIGELHFRVDCRYKHVSEVFDAQ